MDYYVSLGLLDPIQRTDGNYRLFDEDAIDRIKQIKLLQEQRFSLEEIQHILGKNQLNDKINAIRIKLESVKEELHSLSPMVQDSKELATDIKSTLYELWASEKDLAHLVLSLLEKI